MVRVQKIDRLPVSTEIKRLKNATKENIVDLYGTFGLEIFEGKERASILSTQEVKNSRKLFYKIKKWFTGKDFLDYEKNDSLRKVVFKYVCNKKFGFVENIKTKFGRRGLEELDGLCLTGYVSL